MSAAIAVLGVVGRLSSNLSGVKGGKQRRDQSRKQDFEKMALEQRGVERERRLHAEKGPQLALEREEGLRPRLWSKSGPGLSLASCSLASVPLCCVLQSLLVRWECRDVQQDRKALADSALWPSCRIITTHADAQSKASYLWN